MLPNQAGYERLDHGHVLQEIFLKDFRRHSLDAFAADLAGDSGGHRSLHAHDKDRNRAAPAELPLGQEMDCGDAQERVEAAEPITDQGSPVDGSALRREGRCRRSPAAPRIAREQTTRPPDPARAKL